jgi:2-dehydropantoate 2-reductase
MAFTIVGAGAVGAICGVHLASAGQAVRFIETNPAHLAAVRANGLHLSGHVEARICPVILSPEEVRGPLGTVLLAVKARDTEAALAPLLPLLAEDGCVVSLQNGLEEDRIAGLAGAPRTIGAFLTFGGHWRAPGEVVFGGPGTFRIGELDGDITPRLLALRDALGAVQEVEATPNIRGFLWGKLALLAIYFATAITDSDVPALYAVPRWRVLLGRLAGEVVRVAEAEGVRLEAFDGFDAAAFGPDGARDATRVANSWNGQLRYWTRHSGRRTGIWRDLAVHRRRTELDQLIQPVLDRAASRDLLVPGLSRLAGLVRAIEAGRLAQSEDNLAAIEAAQPAAHSSR